MIKPTLYDLTRVCAVELPVGACGGAGLVAAVGAVAVVVVHLIPGEAGGTVQAVELARRSRPGGKKRHENDLVHSHQSRQMASFDAKFVHSRQSCQMVSFDAKLV